MSRKEEVPFEYNKTLMENIQKKLLVIKSQKCIDLFRNMTSNVENKELIFVDKLVSRTLYEKLF